MPTSSLRQQSTTTNAADPQLYSVGPGEYAKHRRFDATVIGCNIMAGLLAPVMTSPIVAAVDATIIKKVASGGQGEPIWQSIKQGWKGYLRNPINFWFIDKQWRFMNSLVMMVYGGTYVTSNLTIAYCESHGIAPRWPTVFISGAVNIGLTVVKDVMMRWFFKKGGGGSQKSAKTPFLASAGFVLRDFLTMWAAFNMAPFLGDAISRYFDCSEFVGQATGKMLVPTGLQTFSSVIHLGALQYAEAPKASAADIWSKIKVDYRATTVGRMCRIAPAYGIAGNLNDSLKSYLCVKFCTQSTQRYNPNAVAAAAQK